MRKDWHLTRSLYAPMFSPKGGAATINTLLPLGRPWGERVPVKVDFKDLIQIWVNSNAIRTWLETISNRLSISNYLGFRIKSNLDLWIQLSLIKSDLIWN